MTPTGSIPDDAAQLELLGTIVANAPIPIFFKDLLGVYVFVNDAYLSATGRGSVEEIVGHTDRDIYPESLATIHQGDDQAALQAGQPTHSTRPSNLRGKEQTFKTVKFPIRNSGGDVIGVCGISIDITDSLREREAREAERKHDIAAKPFERLIATLTDQEGRIAELLSLGYSDKQIADTMSLSPDTVRHHVSSVLKKLRKRSRTQAVIEMLRYRKDK